MSANPISPLIQWRIRAAKAERLKIAELDALIAQGVNAGLPVPASWPVADRLGWIEEQRARIRNGEITATFAFPFPATVNGRLCTLTASECNAVLQAMPPVPLFGEEA